MYGVCSSFRMAVACSVPARWQRMKLYVCSKHLLLLVLLPELFTRHCENVCSWFTDALVPSKLVAKNCS